jgi:hypothetical protein
VAVVGRGKDLDGLGEGLEDLGSWRWGEKTERLSVEDCLASRRMRNSLAALWGCVWLPRFALGRPSRCAGAPKEVDSHALPDRIDDSGVCCGVFAVWTGLDFPGFCDAYCNSEGVLPTSPVRLAAWWRYWVPLREDHATNPTGKRQVPLTHT